MAATGGIGSLGGRGREGNFLSTGNGTGIPPGDSNIPLKIQFLGTGAADWPFRRYPDDPGPLLSGDFRGSASILVNEKILVDCGPTVPRALDLFSVDLTRLKHIIITHTHQDHFRLESLERVVKKAGRKINLWIEKGAAEKARQLERKCRIRPLKVGKKSEMGDFVVLPLPANHRVSGSSEIPLVFLFTCQGKRLLYALDGAWLTTPAWKAIQKLQLDAVIWDATIGDRAGDYRVFAHNSLPMIRLMNQTMRENGVYKDSTRVFLSHLARALHPPHEVLEKRLAEEGMAAAHDGMVVEIGA